MRITSVVIVAVLIFTLVAVVLKNGRPSLYEMNAEEWIINERDRVILHNRRIGFGLAREFRNSIQSLLNAEEVHLLFPELVTTTTAQLSEDFTALDQFGSFKCFVVPGDRSANDVLKVAEDLSLTMSNWADANVKFSSVSVTEHPQSGMLLLSVAFRWDFTEGYYSSSLSQLANSLEEGNFFQRMLKVRRER